ncbi:hypothetical protein GCM10018952_29820 [Streptosporangium vulgare]
MKIEINAVPARLRVEACQIARGADVGDGEAKGIELGLFRLVLHVVRQAHEALRRRQHVTAELRERRSARRPVEQPLPEVFLQGGDPATRDRLRHPGGRRAPSVKLPRSLTLTNALHAPRRSMT